MLVVVLDDIGMDQSSFQPYGWNGAPESPSMPVLAEIAAKGVSFRNFWATPECSPSRAAMLTGRHSFRTGVVTAVVDPMLPAVQLHPSEITLPKLLRPAGYVSGMLGKYHLGGGPENTPPGFGFLPLFNPTSIERMPIGVPTLVRYSRRRGDRLPGDVLGIGRLDPDSQPHLEVTAGDAITPPPRGG
jgi:arylsulfatase A-like enzyme